MSERVIPRESWPAFAEGFSGQHQGWLVAIDAHPLQPLHDLTLSRDRAVVRTGHADDLEQHELRDVRDVRVAASDADENAIERVDIVGPADTMTIRFRTAIAPELVDGAM